MFADFHGVNAPFVGDFHHKQDVAESRVGKKCKQADSSRGRHQPPIGLNLADGGLQAAGCPFNIQQSRARVRNDSECSQAQDWYIQAQGT